VVEVRACCHENQPQTDLQPTPCHQPIYNRQPANYLLVEGQLKLIDFGIAKAIGGDTTSIARESQVG